MRLGSSFRDILRNGRVSDLWSDVFPVAESCAPALTQSTWAFSEVPHGENSGLAIRLSSND
jgi:hypothetical protein